MTNSKLPINWLRIIFNSNVKCLMLKHKFPLIFFPNIEYTSLGFVARL